MFTSSAAANQAVEGPLPDSTTWQSSGERGCPWLAAAAEPVKTEKPGPLRVRLRPTWALVPQRLLLERSAGKQKRATRDNYFPLI